MLTRSLLVWFAAGSILLVAGCEDHTPVRTYSVPAEENRATVNRIEAAVVIAGDNAWFFKAEGDPSLVEPHHDDIAEFLRTLSFGEEEPLTYELPESWEVISENKESTGAPGELPFTTLTLKKGRPQPRLVITRLPVQFGDDEADTQQARDEYVLQNLNRWRRQVALRPETYSELGLPGEAFQTASGESGMLFSMVGQVDRAGRVPAAPAQFAFDPDNSPVPAGWTEAENDEFSLVRYVSGAGVEITVTPIAGGGDVFETISGNVSRWMDQLELDPTGTAEEMAEMTSRREVDGHITIVVNITSKDRITNRDGTKSPGRVSIVGALIIAEGSLWSVRMKGPAQAVQKQITTFNSFLDTAKMKPDPRVL